MFPPVIAMLSVIHPTALATSDRSPNHEQPRATTHRPVIKGRTVAYAWGSLRSGWSKPHDPSQLSFRLGELTPFYSPLKTAHYSGDRYILYSLCKN